MRGSIEPRKVCTSHVREIKSFPYLKKTPWQILKFLKSVREGNSLAETEVCLVNTGIKCAHPE